VVHESHVLQLELQSSEQEEMYSTGDRGLRPGFHSGKDRMEVLCCFTTGSFSKVKKRSTAFAWLKPKPKHTAATIAERRLRMTTTPFVDRIYPLLRVTASAFTTIPNTALAIHGAMWRLFDESCWHPFQAVLVADLIPFFIRRRYRLEDYRGRRQGKVSPDLTS